MGHLAKQTPPYRAGSAGGETGMTNRQLICAWRGAVAAVLIVIAGVAGSSAQDQSAATAKDAIFARKTLMDAIGANMDELTTMTATEKIDLEKGKGFADTIRS